MDFSLRFEDNNTHHDDLVLRFAGQSFVCDTYYFALDPGLLSGQGSANKVRAVLRRLLEQWLSAVENIPDHGTTYLPYDFSDEYTGWLRCQRLGNVVDISNGWAKVGGHSVYPSAVGEYLTRLPGFQSSGSAIQVPLRELVQAVCDSMAENS